MSVLLFNKRGEKIGFYCICTLKGHRRRAVGTGRVQYILLSLSACVPSILVCVRAIHLHPIALLQGSMSVLHPLEYTMSLDIILPKRGPLTALQHAPRCKSNNSKKYASRSPFFSTYSCIALGTHRREKYNNRRAERAQELLI